MDLGGAFTFIVIFVSSKPTHYFGRVIIICGLQITRQYEQNIRSPDSVASTKELFQTTWVADEENCLKKETDLQMKLIGTWNQIAASGRQFGVNLPYYHGRK